MDYLTNILLGLVQTRLLPVELLQELCPEERPVDSDNMFMDFLENERKILKDGFDDWCANELQHESDCSHNHSQLSLHSLNVEAFDKIMKIDDTALPRAAKSSIEKLREVLTAAPNSTKDVEQYWCKIDPTLFELSDMDYVRAKCKWNFRNVLNYETNPKAIERIRYLDLFTQCFGLRYAQENTDEEPTVTCFNYLNGDGLNASDLLAPPYNFNFKPMLDEFPEKDYNPNILKNPTFVKAADRNISSNSKHLLSNSCNEIKSKEFSKNIPNGITSNSFDRPSFGIKSERKKLRNKRHRTYQESSANSSTCSTVNSSTCKNSNHNFVSTDSFKTTVNGNVKLSEKSLCKKKDKHKVDNQDFADDEELETPRRQNSDTVINNGKKLDESDPKIVLKDAEESSEVLEGGIISTHKKKLKETLSRIISHSSYSSDKSKKPTKKHKLLEVKSSNTLPIMKTCIDSGSNISDQLITEFIHNNKIKNNKSKIVDYEESETCESSNLCLLDKLLQKENGLENKIAENKENPIIIIEVNCKEENDKNNENTNKCLRRFVEGDSLCYPGYVTQLGSSKFVNDDKINTGKFFQSELRNKFVKTIFTRNRRKSSEGSRLAQAFKNVELESVNCNKSLNSSKTNNSTSNTSIVKCDKKERRNKAKTHVCENCKKADVICSDKQTIVKKRNKKQNVYVSCWKRFCVIL